jgi:hypothetical protein
MRLEGLGELRNPITSMGIKPGTFRLAAQRINQEHFGMPFISVECRVNRSDLFLSKPPYVIMLRFHFLAYRLIIGSCVFDVK